MNVEIALREALNTLTHRDEHKDLDLVAVMRDGRRRGRRRLASAATAAAGAAAATGIFAVTAGSPAAAAQWSLAVAPEAMNTNILALIEDRLPKGTDVTSVRMEALGAPDGTHQGREDGLPDRYPRSRWDEATEWRVEVTLEGGNVLLVSLAHAESETEANRTEHCEADQQAGIYWTCDVRDLEAQGQEVETKYQVGGVHRDTDLPPGVEPEHRAKALRNSPWMATTPESDVKPGKRYAAHSVSAYPGGDFLVTAMERAHSADPTELEADALFDREDLESIVLDPSLLQAG